MQEQTGVKLTSYGKPVSMLLLYASGYGSLFYIARKLLPVAAHSLQRRRNQVILSR